MIPVRLRNQAEKFIGSVSYEDLSTGIAYARFYGIAKADGTYRFITNPIQAVPQNIGQNGNYTRSFDLVFVNPAVVEGDISVNYTLESENSGGVVRNSAYVQKISNGATTLLAPWQSGSQVAGTNYAARSGLVFTIPKTMFSKDDVLRLNVYVNPDGNNAVFYCDPSNFQLSAKTDNNLKTAASVPTDLLMDIPVKIQ